jgi:hypothetical protein
MITNLRDFKMHKEGKGPKGKDLTVFVRYGGLDLKAQKGFKSKEDKSYHSPPTTRGFYAMPKIAQEMFLVSSMDEFQPGTMPKLPEYPYHKEVKDSEGNMTLSPEDKAAWKKLSDEFDYVAHEAQSKINLSNMRKEFKRSEGNIWHHLEEHTPNNEVIGRNGSWIKTSIKAWQKAFMKDSINGRYGEDFGGMDDRENKGRGLNSINNARGLNGMYSKDHYEVFFDEKV